MTQSVIPILDILDQPEALEQAYRASPIQFETQLKQALLQNPESETLRVWNARLSYSAPARLNTISIGKLIALCLCTGLVSKLPTLLPIDGDWFYPRFIPLIVVLAMAMYFVLAARDFSSTRKIAITALLLCIVYSALLPDNYDSTSIIMALIHLPMFALGLFAISFMDAKWNSDSARIDFVRYLGEMLVFAALILIGGVILTIITISMFEGIGLRIENWYMENIVVIGFVSAPIVATFLYDSVLNRQNKIAPLLSNVFTPLFLITVIGYMIAMLFQGKSPFTDRDFLIVINGLLLAILALTIFSISGKSQTQHNQLSDYINITLVAVTLIINSLALSAIVYRWSEFGTTLNRIVVTGANVIIFIHLILILWVYFQQVRHGDRMLKLEAVIVRYLPLYSLWSLFVAVVIPIIFKYQ